MNLVRDAEVINLERIIRERLEKLGIPEVIFGLITLDDVKKLAFEEIIWEDIKPSVVAALISRRGYSRDQAQQLAKSPKDLNGANRREKGPGKGAGASRRFSDEGLKMWRVV